MSWRKILLAIAAGAVVAAIAPTEASARGRQRVRIIALDRGLAAADFCGGRFPSYGFDACGYREISHGFDSCWRRLPYTPYHPKPRRVWVCG